MPLSLKTSDNLGELEKHQKVIQLIVSDTLTEDDEIAIEWLEELAQMIGSSARYSNIYVFQKVYASEVNHPHPEFLPELINGSSYSGIHAIRQFVDRYTLLADVPGIE